MSESEINDMLKHSPEDGHRALFDQYPKERNLFKFLSLFF